MRQRKLLRGFALSKGRRTLKEFHVDHINLCTAGIFRHTLNHHLPNKWNRDAFDAVNNFLRAAD